MEKNTITHTAIVFGIVLLVAISAITGYILAGMHEMDMDGENMDMHRESFIEQKEIMIEFMLGHGNYKCCLEQPCTYCIEKSPGHGEGATCLCLEDVVNGVHPCGECIGEILEGHGNPFLSEYFARAIAEKVGEDHIDTLRQIIFEKYEMPVDEQL